MNNQIDLKISRNQRKSILLAFALLSGLSVIAFLNPTSIIIVSEIAAVTMALVIFLFTLSIRRYQKDSYLLLLGVSFLFVGIFDMLHIFSSPYLNAIENPGLNISSQLRIVARLFQGMSLVYVFSRFAEKLPVSVAVISFSLLSFIVLVLAFNRGTLPDLYTMASNEAGVVQYEPTVMKTSLELLSIGLYAVSLLRIVFPGSSLSEKSIQFFRVAVASLLLSELAIFLLPINQAWSITLMQFLKLFAYAMIYIAIVDRGLKEPMKLLFTELDENQKHLEHLNQNLSETISQRTGELQRAFDAADEGEKRFRAIFMASTEAISVWRENSLVMCNPAFLQLTGYHEEQTAIGLHWDRFETRFGINPPQQCESEIRRQNGSLFPAQIRSASIPINGELHSIRIIRDISEEQKLMEIKQQALEEKTVLIREILHRTKNNMQVVSSMLALKRIYSSNSEVQSELLDAEGKINAMSLVHAKLYQTKNLTSINLTDYIEDLVELLRESFSTDKKHIRIFTRLDSVEVGIDLVIPFGLVLNELVTNSVKHGLSEQTRDLDISITVHHVTSTDSLKMEYRDNGKGYPESVLTTGGKTLGITTMRTIIENQLGGSIHFSTDGGAVCTISVHIGDYVAEAVEYEENSDN